MRKQLQVISSENIYIGKQSEIQQQCNKCAIHLSTHPTNECKICLNHRLTGVQM